MTFDHNFRKRVGLAGEHQGGPRLLNEVERVACTSSVPPLRASDQVRTRKGVLSVVLVVFGLAEVESCDLLDG